jgi:RHS repeat-associated protein
MEKDDEMEGSGNSYTTEFRMHDPRIERWLSQDPIVHEWESPYAAFANNPVFYADPSGLDGEGPNGECPGDYKTDANGNLTHTYGLNGITNQYEWVPLPQSDEFVNGNPNPLERANYIGEDERRIFFHEGFPEYFAQRTGLNPSYLKFEYVRSGSIGSAGPVFTENLLGSKYSVTYDGEYVGSFQVKKDVILFDTGLNGDMGVKGHSWAEIVKFYPGSSGGGGVTDVAMEEMMGFTYNTDRMFQMRGSSKPPEVQILYLRDVQAHSKEWKTFRERYNFTVKQAKPYYEFAKKNGYIPVYKNKPVLHTINSEEDVKMIMRQGMEPAKLTTEAAIDNELKDKAKEVGKRK